MSQEVRPNLENQVVYTTARIEITGKGYGTGFFYQLSYNKDGNSAEALLLISNKHVFGASSNSMVLRMNRVKENGSPDYGNIVEIPFSGFKELYYALPNSDVDLAAVDVTNHLYHYGGNKFPYYKNLHSELLEDLDYDEIAPGSSVLFVGYPSGFYDDVNNLPLVRRGSLSTLPDVDFKGRGELVIDAEVFGGSSGSPVFITSPSKGKYLLLGVLSHSINPPELIGGRRIAIQIREHIGLGIVIKQRHVKELVDYVRLSKEGSSD